MIMQDKMEKEKADAKNAVEEYVYEMRGKISEDLEKFISEEVRILFYSVYKCLQRQYMVFILIFWSFSYKQHISQKIYYLPPYFI